MREVARNAPQPTSFGVEAKRSARADHRLRRSPALSQGVRKFETSLFVDLYVIEKVAAKKSSSLGARKAGPQNRQTKTRLSQSAAAPASAATGDEPAPPKRSLKVRLLDELQKFFVIVAYLWLVFFVLFVHEWLVLAGHNIGFVFTGLPRSMP